MDRGIALAGDRAEHVVIGVVEKRARRAHHVANAAQVVGQVERDRAGRRERGNRLFGQGIEVGIAGARVRAVQEAVRELLAAVELHHNAAFASAGRLTAADVGAHRGVPLTLAALTLALSQRERGTKALTLALSQRERGTKALTLALSRWERGADVPDIVGHLAERARTGGIDVLLNEIIEHVVNHVFLLGQDVRVVVEVDVAQAIAIVPRVIDLVIIGLRIRDPHALGDIAFGVVRVVERAIARQEVVGTNNVTRADAIAAGVVRFGLVGRRVRAAVGRRDDLRGFVVPVGGQAVVAGEGRDPVERVEGPGKIFERAAVVGVLLAGELPEVAVRQRGVGRVGRRAGRLRDVRVPFDRRDVADRIVPEADALGGHGVAARLALLRFGGHTPQRIKAVAIQEVGRLYEMPQLQLPSSLSQCDRGRNIPN